VVEWQTYLNKASMHREAEDMFVRAADTASAGEFDDSFVASMYSDLAVGDAAFGCCGVFVGDGIGGVAMAGHLPSAPQG
jgi:hypothetical protein